jgi:hypothetical protein
VPSFKSGGKTFELVALDEVTGRDLLTFPRDASAVMGRPIRFSDVQKIGREIEAMPRPDQELHPDFDFLLTVLVWISMRASGEKITYGESLDVPIEFDSEAEPAGKAPAAKKAAKKRQSGNPAKRAAAAAR